MYSHHKYCPPKEFKSLDLLFLDLMQQLIKVDTMFNLGSGLSWIGAAGISASRTESSEGNASVPLVVGEGADGWICSGNLKLTSTVSGITCPA